MTPVLLVGFTAIGGLLAGYLSARLAPRWVFWTLLAVCAVLSGGAVFWVRSVAPVDEIDSGIVVFLILGPFTFCAAVAGVIGLVARRIVSRSEAAP